MSAREKKKQGLFRAANIPWQSNIFFFADWLSTDWKQKKKDTAVPPASLVYIIRTQAKLVIILLMVLRFRQAWSAHTDNLYTYDTITYYVFQFSIMIDDIDSMFSYK